MTNDQIKEIALANGFKLKEQPNGEIDLNPYVYDAFRAAIKRKLKEVMAELKSMESNDNTIEMSAMLDMCQDVIERHIDELSEVNDD